MPKITKLSQNIFKTSNEQPLGRATTTRNITFMKKKIYWKNRVGMHPPWNVENQPVARWILYLCFPIWHESQGQKKYICISLKHIIPSSIYRKNQKMSISIYNEKKKSYIYLYLKIPQNTAIFGGRNQFHDLHRQKIKNQRLSVPSQFIALFKYPIRFFVAITIKENSCPNQPLFFNCRVCKVAYWPSFHPFHTWMVARNRQNGAIYT